MTTKFDGDDTISSSNVKDRMRELESDLEDLEWVVTRDSDNEELGRFEGEAEAELFVQNEDFDPSKITVFEEEEDEELREELNELEEFERDCRNTFGNLEWNSGLTLRNGDSIDSDFGKEYYNSNYGEPDGDLSSYVDWRSYANELTDGRDYATLNGNYYYDI